MIDRLDIIDKLHDVQDPELDMNIVDLGLVYNITLSGESVKVQISLTYPGCPLGPTIIGDIQKKLTEVPGMKEVEVEIVWQPPWQKEMIQPDILEELKFLGRVR